jgi:hypothetical protein
MALSTLTGLMTARQQNLFILTTIVSSKGKPRRFTGFVFLNLLNPFIDAELQTMADGKQYVAKRFFNVGHGPDKVTMTENADQLWNELYQLKQGSWFLDEFFEQAEQTGIEVSTGMCLVF